MLMLAAGALALVAAPALAQTPPSTTTTTRAPTTTVPPTTAPPTTAAPAAPVTTTTVAPTTTTTKAAAPTITAILECSYYDTGTGKYNTVWGYNNTYTSTQTLTAGGTQNRFDNPQKNVGQPSSFQVGIKHNVFIVTHTGSSSWELKTIKTTAPGKACSTNPVAIASDSWSSLIVLAIVTLVLGTILFWYSFRRAKRP